MSNDQSKGDVLKALDQLDLLFALRRYNDAMQLLVSLLPAVDRLRLSDFPLRDGALGDWYVEAGEITQRLAAHWRRLLQSPVDFGRINSILLLSHLDVLHGVLMATVEGHLDSHARALHQSLNGKYQPQDLIRKVLGWCPNSELSWLPFGHFKMLPDVIVLQALATLAAPGPLSAQADLAKRSAMAFLAGAPLAPAALAKYGAARLLARAWAGCAFADTNAAAAREFIVAAMIASAGLAPPDGALFAPERQRPLAVVIVEPEMDAEDQSALIDVLEGLTQRADVHILGVGVEVGAALSAFGHFSTSIPDAGKLSHLYKQVLSWCGEKTPDLLVLSPSRVPLWQVLLGSMRLARRQWVVAGGTPALALSCVDAVLRPRSEPPVAGPKTPPTVIDVPPRVAAVAVRGQWRGVQRLVLRVALDAERIDYAQLQQIRQIDQHGGDAVTLLFNVGGSALRAMVALRNLARELSRPEILHRAEQRLPPGHVVLAWSGYSRWRGANGTLTLLPSVQGDVEEVRSANGDLISNVLSGWLVDPHQWQQWCLPGDVEHTLLDVPEWLEKVFASAVTV